MEVRVGDSPPQRVPVNARLHEGILTVSGRPVEFGADAAKELIREFSLGQRADFLLPTSPACCPQLASRRISTCQCTSSGGPTFPAMTQPP